MNMEQETIKARCEAMRAELGIPATKFCQNISLSTGSYHDWRRNKTTFSEKRLNSIDEYLKKYGF